MCWNDIILPLQPVCTIIDACWEALKKTTWSPSVHLNSMLYCAIPFRPPLRCCCHWRCHQRANHVTNRQPSSFNPTLLPLIIRWKLWKKTWSLKSPSCVSVHLSLLFLSIKTLPSIQHVCLCAFSVSSLLCHVHLHAVALSMCVYLTLFYSSSSPLLAVADCCNVCGSVITTALLSESRFGLFGPLWHSDSKSGWKRINLPERQV